jgi:pyruvate/2-oxoglutarate/acetoin dehydrogenase E1 component
MSYKDELIKAMGMLAEDDRTIFLGQEIITNGFYKTMSEVPEDKMIELPIMEDVQMGMSTGLSLMGFVPVSLYTRMDFFLLTMNQLVNHLDKIEDMSHGDFKPKVIIRTVVGEHVPMDCGPQHTQDFTEMIETVLNSVKVVKLESMYDIVPAYQSALTFAGSTVLVESKELYGKET